MSYLKDERHKQGYDKGNSRYRKNSREKDEYVRNEPAPQREKDVQVDRNEKSRQADPPRQKSSESRQENRSEARAQIRTEERSQQKDRSCPDGNSRTQPRSVPIWVYAITLLGDMGIGWLFFLAIFWFVFDWGFFVVLAFFFTLIGSIIANLERARVIRNGVLTRGRVVNKETTGKKVNKKPEYRVTFQYKTMQGELMEADIKTAKIDMVTDEEKEFLIYNSDAPHEIIAMDVLPLVVQSWVKNNY